MRQTLSQWCERQGSALLQEWDAEKNGDMTPHTVSFGSRYKAFWRCAAGHTWQAAVYTRTAGAGCPWCVGKRLLQNGNDLASRFPELAGEWHPTKNAPLTPADVSPGTHRKVWWRCAQGHEWHAEVKARTEGSGCPVCANRAVLAGFNDLATVNPLLAAQWHPTKNGALTPREVVAGTDRRVWWQCPKNPAHAWRAAISSRSCGLGCPVCAGKRVLPGFNDLAALFPAVAAEWDSEKNGTLRPEMLTASSNKTVWWLCPLGHSYAASVSSRTARGSGCPYCAGRKVLPGFNDLASREPKIAAQWHQPLNGGLTPEAVTCGSSKKVFWRCEKGHVWHAVISSRAGKQKCGCPVCAGKVKAGAALRYQEIIDRASHPAAAGLLDKTGNTL